ncbi:hypothetical protein HPB48_007078 [Haemaphysalis longicornis]|uniref:Carboxylesterase type B domain-containing protein n=1 Tax=Haemaphysalis longicornis TaxID=44386 RepID=A0A9J6G351_HAELO|nr:hypothetical protein HPB48_007078 [Haemaphysalis longicornis]
MHVHRQEADASQALPLACPQPLMDNIGFGTRWIVDEDCLRLNIWVPRGCEHHDSAESPYRCPNKTVLFVLSGSLFQQGDAGNATKDGSLLAALGDVVVVTFAFRLGALGFLYASADRVWIERSAYCVHATFTRTKPVSS